MCLTSLAARTFWRGPLSCWSALHPAPLLNSTPFPALSVRSQPRTTFKHFLSKWILKKLKFTLSRLIYRGELARFSGCCHHPGHCPAVERSPGQICGSSAFSTDKRIREGLAHSHPEWSLPPGPGPGPGWGLGPGIGSRPHHCVNTGHSPSPPHTSLLGSAQREHHVFTRELLNITCEKCYAAAASRTTPRSS